MEKYFEWFKVQEGQVNNRHLLDFFFLLMEVLHVIFFFHIKVDLNEAEKIISRAENLYKQPYFWNLLHSLPHLQLNSFYTEDELATITHFLKVIQK